MILSAQNQNKISQYNLNHPKVARAKNAFRKVLWSKPKGTEINLPKLIFTKKSDQKNGNGLATVNGLINGNGLSDGNGLTINLFSNNKYECHQTKRRQRLNQIIIKNQRRKWLKVIVATILIIFPLSIYMIEFDDKDFNIQIDGEFEDWEKKGITQYLDTDYPPVVNPSANLIDCRFCHKDDILDFYVRAEWDLFGSQSTHSWNNDELYKLDIFIDHDLNVLTGYQVEGIGADERIEIQGQHGIITKSYSYYFDNNNNLDWNGWVRNSDVEVVKKQFRLEGKHYLSTSAIGSVPALQSDTIVKDQNLPNLPKSTWLGDIGSNQVCIVLQMMDSFGNKDLTTPILTGSDTWLQLEIIDISPDNILAGNNIVPIIALDFNSNLKPQHNNNDNNDNSMEIESLAWSFEFVQESSIINTLNDLGELTLFGDENRNMQLDSQDYPINNYQIDQSPDGIFTLDFSPPLLVPGDVGKNFIMAFKSKYTSDHDSLLKIDLYPSDVKSFTPIIIDIPDNSDDKMLMYLGEVPQGIAIDGIFGDWSNTGQVNQDIDIPTLNKNDDARDIREIGIDVNPRTGTLSCYLSVSGELLQGTPVPPIFYSDVLSTSAQASSSTQKSHTSDILPMDDSKVITQLPDELLGTDKISIFIDTDQNVNTGYKPNWLAIGAEYLITITGRDGFLDNHELFKYESSTGTTWCWRKVIEVPAEKDYWQIETQIDWGSLGFEIPDNFEAIFIISDWSGETKDSASMGYLCAPYQDILTKPSIFNLDEESAESNTDPGLSSHFVNGDNGSTDPQGTRSAFVNITSNDMYISAMPNQRKLVRDSNGYWYAFWHNDSKVMAKRSDDSLGTTWSANAVVLAGGESSVINGANGSAMYPAVAISRDMTNLSNNSIHLVWTRVNNSNYTICYSKCVNLTNNANFINPNSWCSASGSQGYDELTNNIYRTALYGYASIALDSSGQPHIVWQDEYRDFDYMINYTMYDNSAGWHDGNSKWLQISPGGNFDHRKPCIDISPNGTIHVVYQNLSASPYVISYRQCWDPIQSMSPSNWGAVNHSTGWDDVALSHGGGPLNEPSMVCDAQNRVWIVTYKSGTWDLWHTMEDFQDSTYWPGPFLINNKGENRYPTIGYDTSGVVYCVWQHLDPSYNSNVTLSYNTSSGWVTPIDVVSGNENVYPQIPKNLSASSNLVGFIYKDHTNFDLEFESIPEFSDLLHFISIILIFQILVMITNKRKWFKIKARSKV